MRKMQIGVALLALFAFGALTAASASAAYLLAEWLLNGVAITTEDLVEITGELLLEDTKAILGGAAKVLCSGIFDGWVGPNSLDFISEVLSLTGVAISNTPLVGESLTCTAQAGCETNTNPLVWPVGFPVETEVELLEQTGGPFFEVLFSKEIGWEITNCLVLGTVHEDTCTGTAAAELTLENATVLLGAFSPGIQELNGLKLALCSASGAETGVAEGSAPFTPSGGGELTASSETSTS